VPPRLPPGSSITVRSARASATAIDSAMQAIVTSDAGRIVRLIVRFMGWLILRNRSKTGCAMLSHEDDNIAF
jgi:hypothetical protein